MKNEKQLTPEEKNFRTKIVMYIILMNIFLNSGGQLSSNGETLLALIVGLVLVIVGIITARIGLKDVNENEKDEKLKKIFQFLFILEQILGVFYIVSALFALA